MKPSVVTCTADSWVLAASNVMSCTIRLKTSAPTYYILPVTTGDEAPTDIPVTEETSAKLFDTSGVEQGVFSENKDVYVYSKALDGLIWVLI